MVSIRKAHQDTMADPFEGSGSGWESLDDVAENFTWATCNTGGPATPAGANHHARPRRHKRTRR